MSDDGGAARAIGDAIRDARRSAGLTQGDHAAIAGVSERTLRDIERGTGAAGLAAVIRVASAVGLALEARRHARPQERTPAPQKGPDPRTLTLEERLARDAGR